MTAKLLGNFLLSLIIFLTAACGGGGGDDGESSTGRITIDPITADDVVNAAEAAGIINVTGSVGGAAGPGGIVNFAVNGTAYFGSVGADSTFSIAVSGADLAADTSFHASVTFTVAVVSSPTTGLAFTTSTHTVDLTARAKITVDNITDDDVVATVVTSTSVTIPGSINFDATQVDFSSVTFGPDGASPIHDGHVEDVNDDGYPDMVFHFKIQETGIVCGDNEATLVGETFNETTITGTETVKTIGCN